MRLKSPVSLIATFVLVVALAQLSYTQSSESANSSSIVSYVFVARPTHLDGFAVSSTGKLTPVPGSPFSNIALAHLSITKKFLFGVADDKANIYSYSIAANGSIRQVAVIDAQARLPQGCYSGEMTQLDRTASTLYNFNYCSGGDSYIQAFKIQGDGSLQFLGNTDIDMDMEELVGPSQLYFLSNNKYAYQVGCNDDDTEPRAVTFQRESSGVLVNNARGIEAPKGPNSDTVYCPYSLAADDNGHVAVAVQPWSFNDGQPIGPFGIATYTANSTGKLSTTSSYQNMPTSTINFIDTLSISPSGKLLAAGGNNGFQIFHYNGSSPTTKYTNVLNSSEQFLQFAWDSSNHLFALSASNLRVFTATPTSFVQASGSPISIPEAVSVIAVSVN